MTPRLSTLVTLSILALAALACAGLPESGPAKIGALDGSHVLVAPFNLGIRRAPELDRTTGPVAAELVDVLLHRGAQVETLDQRDALAIWQEAYAATGSGEDFAEASQRFAQLAAQEADFDLVLMPSLVLRGGEVKGQHVSWDGVRRDLPTQGHVVDPSFVIQDLRANGLTGLVSAASLHVVALRPSGAVAFEGLAGLDVLQQAKRASGDAGQWELAPREEPLRDLEHVRQGVELAFDRELPKTARAWQR